MWPKIIVSGIALGSFYTLIALRFALIYGVTRNFNLAHGELLVLAGYVSFWLWHLGGWSFGLTFPAAIVILLLAGQALQRVFARLSEPLELNSIVLSFGLAIVIQNAMLFCFSGDYRLIQVPVLSRGFAWQRLYISYGQLTLLVLSLLVIVVLYGLMRHTYVGKALRATIQDKEAASLAGINVVAMEKLAFGIGAALIGLAGPLYGCTHYLYPATGHEVTLMAVTITIFAGVGRMRGVLLAGWALGLAEACAVVLWGASWREMVAAVLLLAVLAVKPKGILGSLETR